jgi:hypothetical protein
MRHLGTIVLQHPCSWMYGPLTDNFHGHIEIAWIMQKRYQDYMGYGPIYTGDRTWRNYWDCTFSNTGCDFGFPRVSWLRVSVRTNTTKGATAENIELSAQAWDDLKTGWVSQVQEVCCIACYLQ